MKLLNFMMFLGFKLLKLQQRFHFSEAIRSNQKQSEVFHEMFKVLSKKFPGSFQKFFKEALKKFFPIFPGIFQSASK